MIFTALVACAESCPFSFSNETAGTGTSACGDTGLAQRDVSFDDKRVKAPEGAKVLVFTAVPNGDWDIFICAGTREVGRSAEAPFEPERANAVVKPGRTYTLRAYNYLDGTDLVARYAFLG